MKRCPGCNTPNPDNSKRCFKCRTELTDVKIETAVREELPDRKNEFAQIFKNTFRGAAARISDIAKHKEALLTVTVIIGLIGLLTSVKGGFGLKLALIAGVIIGLYILFAVERLLRVLTDIRNIRQAELFDKMKNEEDK